MLSDIQRSLMNCVKKTPNRRIILHHNNASSHSAHTIADFLSSKNVKLMPHCMSSSDLSPNDFFWFQTIKKKMHGERFVSSEATVDAFRPAVSEVPESEWKIILK